MSDDKREFVRLPVESVLQIQIANKTSWTQALCSNMSAGGLLATTQVPIAIDTQVTIQLKDDPQKFHAQGKVIRLVESDDDYLLAIRYNDASH